ncbi:CSLREA domain-containing protein [Acinetobacter marinus]|uniref:CSLREA domain-containing protein n=1 Tax=Acinetobacter marinus TaxID=281375 RepID=A0A1G6KS41_9GAMM|nr:CSLREA domain-containing protein [Acinetobacter marinus]SDC33899.1 CSLREA domain-containing protein [Acinetobacter marinus]
MKNYKKAVLALSIVAALPLMAATEDEVIYVTTFADEDGENSNACSLREAITTAAKNESYGGCKVGKTSPAVTDRIDLEAGEYVITKPLTPSSMINILGKSPTDWNVKDVITGDYPQRQPLKTTIKGNNSFTLFDTTAGKSTLTLQTLRLENGGASRGGAIKAGATVSLVQVEVKNSTATEGGAIYLSGVGSALDVTNSVFEGNTATRGSVLAMSCIDNLTFTSRTISFKGSSIVNNGQASSQSVFEICGVPDMSLSSNTIAQNIASTNDGSIIKYTADSLPNQNGSAKLSDSSKLTLLSNTIVNNTAYSTLLYDAVANKSLGYNIIAYNTGYSCRYLLGDLPTDNRMGFTLNYNGLESSSGANSYCQLPYTVLKDETTKNISSYSQSTLMSSLQVADQYTAFMPMYFLNNTSNNPLVNIDENSRGCEPTDQRGLSRLATNRLIWDQTGTTTQTENRCDIGSTELVKLAANDMTSTNTSQLKAIEDFEAQVEFFQDLLDDEETEQEFRGYYQQRRDFYQQRIDNYKNSLRYRQAYFDIFANSVPAELVVNGKREIQHFDADLYNVETYALGTSSDVFGSTDEDVFKYTGAANAVPEGYHVDKDGYLIDDNLRCTWDNKLKTVLMYRTDGKASQAGDYSYCRYTISLKSDPNIKSIGVTQATFVNIAPVAEDDEYTLKWGTEQRVKLDLLANDHDDGDGTSSQEGFPVGKKVFYVNDDGISAPIKFDEVDSNLLIEAEHRVLCDDESREWCYGGDIYIKPKNSFNKFNYTLTYQVFDADGTLSNTADVKLINTATTSDDTRGSSGGGGSTGLLSIFGLLGLALLRRRLR